VFVAFYKGQAGPVILKLFEQDSSVSVVYRGIKMFLIEVKNYIEAVRCRSSLSKRLINRGLRREASARLLTPGASRHFECRAIQMVSYSWEFGIYYYLILSRKLKLRMVRSYDT